MNKNITLGIGFILVAIIAYQGYLLSQKDKTALNSNSVNKVVNEDKKPQIDITFNNQQQKTNIKQNQNSINSFKIDKDDQEKIMANFKNLINSIFASKDVQNALTQFKSQATMGIKELQKELQNLPKQLDNLSTELSNDPFFGEVLKNLKMIDTKSFKEENGRYITTLDIPKDAKVKIDVNDNLLTITSTKTTKTINSSQNKTIQSNSTQSSQIALSIPHDSLVEKLKTEYKNGKLMIIIPKIGKKSSI